MRIRITLVMLLIAVIMTMSGCRENIEDMPMVSSLTQQELIDYYKEGMEYTASYESRPKIALGAIEKFEVTDKNIKLKAIKAQEIIEAELSKDYRGATDTVSNSQAEFIKSVLDDKVLIKDKVEAVNGGSGYYFVDVSYKVQPKGTGSILDSSKYVGIHGIFVEDGLGNTYMDEYYTGYVNSKIQGVLAGQNLENTISSNFNAAVNDITNVQQEIRQQEIASIDETIDEETIEEETITTEESNIANEDTNEAANENANNVEVINEETPESVQSITSMGSADQSDINKQVNFVRKGYLDIKECNRLAGLSTTQTAIMPNLLSIYSPIPSGTSISGYGLFPQGNFDLAIFGYNRANTSGKVVLRYVFKEDLKNYDVIHFKAVYPVDITINNNLDKVESDVISDTIFNETRKIVDRADRAIMNNDITALMSGEILGDLGASIMYCNKNKTNYVLSNYSKVVDVIAKRGNKYLVKIDQYTEESIRGSGMVVKYNSEYYAVVEQNNEKFIINDFLCTSSKLMGDPDLVQESAYIKSLVALSSGGEVTDKNKKEIEQLMASLYKESTDRSLEGMYNCFNEDTSLLTDEHREYLNSRLRGWLTAEGVNTKAIYEGDITKWISGSAKQAEFIANEKITYVGANKVKEMQAYYRVSAYKDEWKIDEIKIIDSGK